MSQMILHEYAVDRITVAENMISHGGSFIKAIGEALMHADRENAIKIKETWPTEWAKYLSWNG